MRHRLVLHHTGAALLALVSSTTSSKSCGNCCHYLLFLSTLTTATTTAFTPVVPNNNNNNNSKNYTRNSRRFMSSSSSSSSSRIVFQHYDTIESTQDLAKEILQSSSWKEKSDLKDDKNNHDNDDNNNNDNENNHFKMDTATMLAITAQEQTKGRGTSGRTWMGDRGNVFLTMAFPMSQIPISPITLFPLQVGILVAQQIQQHIRYILHNKNHDNNHHTTTNFQHVCRKKKDNNNNNNNNDDNKRQQETDSTTSNDDPTTPTSNKSSNMNRNNDDVPVIVRVKWPNDVLVNDEKVAGILIESFLGNDNSVWMLVGIGVNLVSAPTIPTEGPNRGRTATSIQSYYHHDCHENTTITTTTTTTPSPLFTASDGNAVEANTDMTSHGDASSLSSSSSSSSSNSSLTTAQVFAQDLAEGLVQWLDDPTASSKKVHEEWKSWANFGQVQLIRETNEQVIPINLKEDGQLVVMDQDGNERLLVADYLF